MHEPNTMDQLTEEARALHPAAHETHAERHGLQTFTPGTHLPLEEAGERTGIRPSRLRYYGAIQHLDYEEVIEWAEIARGTLRGTSTTSSPGAAWMVLGRD